MRLHRVRYRSLADEADADADAGLAEKGKFGGSGKKFGKKFLETKIRLQQERQRCTLIKINKVFQKCIENIILFKILPE